ncbi:hypothetical protein [Aquifex aeolicus]|uniref:Uncharacterized protein aq_668 n=1 Tax=Aquifex aeolicus (strain VF5) TaxID=224324 RepID=Y668_AQUAE|nr:hypothetical protein [Aquifex aeolicus]O66899.1 RecName: Full=Uncharacterized protein aq_668 [Aquifex aeolicus VF5]AAC06865.1 putative protein [Aquifex aeolicus VF5]
MSSVKFLQNLKRINEEDLRNLMEKGETFVLYVRSERLYDKVKEIFDVDVVFPELAKSFEGIPFYWGDADELKELNVIPPSVLIFKEGKPVEFLQGIKTWAEYTRKLKESLLC